jgi:predicted Zn-dependent peptidase
MTTATWLVEPATLANGIPYTVSHRAGADVTTVSVWILAGSRHEDVPGVAHLLEHVVMQAVPAGHRMRVVDEIESWGGDANAMTTRDHVVLYARVPTPDASQALAVLAATATATAFDDGVVTAERRVVQEELRLAAADPTDIVHDVFFRTAYGAHPMGRPVGGTAEGAAGLGRSDLVAWSGRHVRPGLLGVVVCGGMAAEDVARVLAGSQLAALDGPAVSRPDDETPPIRSARRDLPLASDTVAVVIGGEGFALADPRLCAAQIVMELLARGNGSVLNEEIRSRRGLSYDVSGGASGYRASGSWRIAISTAPEHRDEVVDLATDLIRKAVARGWSSQEVSAARKRAAGLLRLETETTLEETLLYGDYAYVGGSPDWSLAGYMKRLSSVMTDQLVVATAGGDDAAQRR